MFTRLFVLLLMIATTVAVSPPAHASTLTASLFCYPNGNGKSQCQASASGGTGSYTYIWSPTPFYNGGDMAIFSCTPYRYSEFFVTVRDSSGATASAQGWTNCGEAW